MIFSNHKIFLGKKRIACRLFVRKSEIKNQLENPGIYGRIILNLI
jgi:hypothetical protein